MVTKRECSKGYAFLCENVLSPCGLGCLTDGWRNENENVRHNEVSRPLVVVEFFPQHSLKFEDRSAILSHSCWPVGAEPSVRLDCQVGLCCEAERLWPTGKWTGRCWRLEWADQLSHLIIGLLEAEAGAGPDTAVSQFVNGLRVWMRQYLDQLPRGAGSKPAPSSAVARAGLEPTRHNTNSEQVETAPGAAAARLLHAQPVFVSATSPGSYQPHHQQQHPRYHHRADSHQHQPQLYHQQPPQDYYRHWPHPHTSPLSPPFFPANLDRFIGSLQPDPDPDPGSHDHPACTIEPSSVSPPSA
ncbi:unnamed protein product, partial [Protopolystoma xenopodis]